MATTTEWSLRAEGFYKRDGTFIGSAGAPVYVMAVLNDANTKWLAGWGVLTDASLNAPADTLIRRPIAAEGSGLLSRSL